MKPIRKNDEIPAQDFAHCHDGEGTLFCKSLLDGLGSMRFPFMHSDVIPEGVSIGDHLHADNEEIYYLVSGKGILTYDGERHDMLPGDISLCLEGHTHGFTAIEDCVLIVVGSK